MGGNVTFVEKDLLKIKITQEVEIIDILQENTEVKHIVFVT